MSRGEQLNLFPEVAEYPFDPATRWMATVHRDGDRYFTAVKGAPEEVLALTDRAGVAAEPLGQDSRAAWLDVAEELAAEGLRVLAVAVGPCADPCQPVGRDLAFLGLMALGTRRAPTLPTRSPRYAARASAS